MPALMRSVTIAGYFEVSRGRKKLYPMVTCGLCKYVLDKGGGPEGTSIGVISGVWQASMVSQVVTSLHAVEKQVGCQLLCVA